MTDQADMATDTVQHEEAKAIAGEIGTVEERTLAVLRNILLEIRHVKEGVSKMHTRIDAMEQQAADFSPEKLGELMNKFGN
jgi:hypothetical protein